MAWEPKSRSRDIDGRAFIIIYSLTRALAHVLIQFGSDGSEPKTEGAVCDPSHRDLLIKRIYTISMRGETNG